MTKPEIIERILHPGIVAVIRVDSAAALLPICEALLAGGVTGLEITMTSPDALATIAEASRRFADRGALVGVGSVLDPETCRAAVLAGAQFVVTPVCRPEVVQMALRYGKPVACGAYTPTEALTAPRPGRTSSSCSRRTAWGRDTSRTCSPRCRCCGSSRPAG